MSISMYQTQIKGLESEILQRIFKYWYSVAHNYTGMRGRVRGKKRLTLRTFSRMRGTHATIRFRLELASKHP